MLVIPPPLPNHLFKFLIFVIIEIVELRSLTSWLDQTLLTTEFKDYPNALNGLQLENEGIVTRLAVAVDAAESVIERAVDSKADLLIVHHGLFWSGNRRITGSYFRKLQTAMANGLAIYSSHLPLDAHTELGNNACLVKALGLKRVEAFATIGIACEADMSLRTLLDRLEAATGFPAHLAPGGPDRVRRVAVVSGGSGTLVDQAAAEGFDTLIAGEGPHHTFAAAEEAGINLIYGGHYATETFGVKALASAIESKFNLPWEFIDYPSGL